MYMRSESKLVRLFWRDRDLGLGDGEDFGVHGDRDLGGHLGEIANDRHRHLVCLQLAVAQLVDGRVHRDQRGADAGAALHRSRLHLASRRSSRGEPPDLVEGLRGDCTSRGEPPDLDAEGLTLEDALLLPLL